MFPRTLSTKNKSIWYWGGILRTGGGNVYQNHFLVPCGDNSVATKRNLVEILRFRHFSRHVVFDAEGDKFRNKRIEDYITVSVVIDMECGNTKN